MPIGRFWSKSVGQKEVFYRTATRKSYVTPLSLHIMLPGANDNSSVAYEEDLMREAKERLRKQYASLDLRDHVCQLTACLMTVEEQLAETLTNAYLAWDEGNVSYKACTIFGCITAVILLALAVMHIKM